MGWFSRSSEKVDDQPKEVSPVDENNNGWTNGAGTILQPTSFKTSLPLKDIDKFLRRQMGNLLDMSDSQKMLVGTMTLSAFVLGFQAGRFQNPWRRFTTVSDIPLHYFGDTAPYLRGRVISVSDGDTIRFRHTPSRWFQTSTLAPGEKVSEVALPIRICTIDTPETAKFGNEGQPFGQEAKEYLSNQIDNRIVYCQLLQSDQYGRAVAQVKFGYFPSLWPSYVDEMMLKAGLAEVYLGKGAVYGHRGKDAYLQLMEQAKAQKRGMWSSTQNQRESAADYKARIKDENS